MFAGCKESQLNTEQERHFYKKKRFVFKNVFLVQGFLGDDDNILSVLTRVFLGEIPTSAEFLSLLYMRTTQALNFV